MKKKVTLILLCSVLFLLVFVVTCWNFISWKQVGDYLMNASSAEMERHGVTMSYRDLTVDKGLNPHVHVTGLELVSFAGIIEAGDLFISLEPFGSLQQLGGAFSLSIPSLIIRPRIGGMTEMTSGGTGDFLIRKDLLICKDMNFEGDISISGGARLDLDTGRLASEGLLVQVPEEIDRNLDVLTGYFPIKRTGPGQWSLK
ncbi:MAG: hypothetical protein JW971_01770 [Synergistales bacterium]|nr:hypothetical protein [Synergistales bacterium]